MLNMTKKGMLKTIKKSDAYKTYLEAKSKIPPEDYDLKSAIKKIKAKYVGGKACSGYFY